MIIIKVDDILLDLYPDTEVAITFKGVEVGDITSRSASYSSRITAPPTENNRNIFGFADDINTAETKQYTKRACRVLIDGMEIPELNSLIVSKANGGFEFNLYTNEIDTFEPLKTAFCSDIDLGVSFVLNSANIQTYMVSTGPIVCAKIDYGTYNPPNVNVQQFYKNSKWKERNVNRKPDCLCASTANLGLTGLAAIDGVTPVDGARVLAKNQSTASQNGVYVASAGAWTRAPEFTRVAECFEAVIFVRSGTTNGNKQFIQTAVSGSFTFTVGLAAVIGGQLQAYFERTWSFTKSAIGAHNYGDQPVMNYLEQEWEFPILPQIGGAVTYAVNLELTISLASGSLDSTVRLHFEDASGNLVNVLNTNYTTTGAKSLSSTITATTKFTKVLVTVTRNIDNGGGAQPTLVVSALNITIPSFIAELKEDFYLPTIRFHSVIEEILDSLGAYTLEYPNSDTAHFENLLLTYSRSYFGYRDASVDVGEGTSINMSKFILPDIFQIELLREWLFRTQSLIRVKDNVIEVKPVYNIIKDKLTANVDWTAKRVRGKEDIDIANPWAVNNYFYDGASKEDLDIIKAKGIDPQTEVLNYSPFIMALSNIGLEKNKTAYTSNLFSSQMSEGIPYSGGNDRLPFAPVYDWTSVDRKDFKHAPKLRIFRAFTTGIFHAGAYIDGTFVSAAINATYKSLSLSHDGASWEGSIAKSYSAFVSAIQNWKAVKRYYNLTLNDIANLDEFKVIYDNGNYFLFLGIQGWVPNKTTAVKLLKIE